MRYNAIQFYSSNNTEVLRLSKDGITANPEIPVDDAAKLVLAAIESNIKFLVQKAVEDEREACLKECEQIAVKYYMKRYATAWQAQECIAAIKARGES